MDCRFTSCVGDGPAIDVGALGSMMLSASLPTHEWGDCSTFLSVDSDSAEVIIDGGILRDIEGTGPLIRMTGPNTGNSSNVDLFAVQVLGGDQPLLEHSGGGGFYFADGSVSLASATLASLSDGANVEFNSSDLEIAAGAPASNNCVQSNLDGTGSLRLVQSVLHGCETALEGSIPARLDLVGTEIHNVITGVNLPDGEGGEIAIRASDFHDIASSAVRVGGGAGQNALVLTVRDSVFETTPECFRIAGDAGSLWDFGWIDDELGENTFTCTTTGLNLLTPTGTLVYAEGNTWHPNVQAADGSGLYSVAGAGAVLEVTSGSGLNYSVNAGTTLRLAENDP
jgi:prepilin-type processing-associated H-X9-DG protein